MPAFALWMIAQAKGYYKADGLDVKCVTARGGVDVAKQDAPANVVIGGATGDTPMMSHARGIAVKAVAVLSSGSLMKSVSHAHLHTESPRKLKGKTVTSLAYTDPTY